MTLQRQFVPASAKCQDLVTHLLRRHVLPPGFCNPQKLFSAPRRRVLPPESRIPGLLPKAVKDVFTVAPEAELDEDEVSRGP